MSSGLSVSGLRWSICGSQQSLVSRERRDAWIICPSGFPDRIPFPPPCALNAATRLALGSTGAGCQQDGRWTGRDQVSEVGANSLHSCPAPPPLASRALLGPWCPQPQSFPSFSQDPEFLAPRKGDLMSEMGAGDGAESTWGLGRLMQAPTPGNTGG